MHQLLCLDSSAKFQSSYSTIGHILSLRVFLRKGRTKLRLVRWPSEKCAMGVIWPRSCLDWRVQWVNPQRDGVTLQHWLLRPLILLFSLILRRNTELLYLQLLLEDSSNFRIIAWYRNPASRFTSPCPIVQWLYVLQVYLLLSCMSLFSMNSRGMRNETLDGNFPVD